MQEEASVFAYENALRRNVSAKIRKMWIFREVILGLKRAGRWRKIEIKSQMMRITTL